MKELTKGTPWKVLVVFAIPMILGSILQQLYNITDSKIVSMYLGTEALSAVGSTTSITNLLIGFISGLTQGFAILIARSFGAGNKKELREFVYGTVKITAISACILMVLSLLFLKGILYILKIPANIYNDAYSYIFIILFGMLFVSLYNMCAAILRAIGDSISPLICLIISVALNIGFDFLFIAGFKMGIKGAAYATVLAQLLSGVSILSVLLFRYKEIKPMKEDTNLSKVQYNNLISSGLSMGLMGSIVSIGTVVLSGAINSLGTTYISAHISGRRFFDILMILIFTLGQAMTTYASQNMGAGKKDRVKTGVRQAIIIDTVITTCLIFVCFIFGKSVVSWIATTDDEQIINAGVTYIRVGIVFFYILGPLFILRCTLQGMGHKIVPLVSSFCEMVIKIISALFFVPVFKYIGVCFTEPISWIVMVIPLIIVYIKVVKKELAN